MNGSNRLPTRSLPKSRISADLPDLLQAITSDWNSDATCNHKRWMQISFVTKAFIPFKLSKDSSPVPVWSRKFRILNHLARSGLFLRNGLAEPATFRSDRSGLSKTFQSTVVCKRIQKLLTLAIRLNLLLLRWPLGNLASGIWLDLSRSAGGLTSSCFSLKNSNQKLSLSKRQSPFVIGAPETIHFLKTNPV